MFYEDRTFAADPVHGVTAEADEARAKVNLDRSGQGKRKDPPRGAVPEFPKVKRRVIPQCVDAFSCLTRECVDGQREYVVITEVTERSGAVPDIDHQTFCGLPNQDVSTLAVREFYETQVKIPAPKVHPAGVTLANYPSVFHTTFRAYEAPTSIQNANVRLKFTPRSFRWNFGDGKTLTTSDAGKPYDPVVINRVEEIERHYKNTHRYETTGRFTPSVTVIINGQFSVDGGSWQDISGFLEATSPVTPVTVKEARAELVTGNTD